jgi:hypothetical protein
MSQAAGYNKKVVTTTYGGTVDGTVPVLVAPYGGITVTNAYAFTGAAVAGHASNYLAVSLLNGGTAGTATTSVASGPGTAAGFAAHVPGAMTVVAAADELTAGQVLQAVFDFNGSITPGTMGVIVEYVTGKG